MAKAAVNKSTSLFKSFKDFLLAELNIGRRPNQQTKSNFNSTGGNGLFLTTAKRGGFGYTY